MILVLLMLIERAFRAVRFTAKADKSSIDFTSRATNPLLWLVACICHTWIIVVVHRCGSLVVGRRAVHLAIYPVISVASPCLIGFLGRHLIDAHGTRMLAADDPVVQHLLFWVVLVRWAHQVVTLRLMWTMMKPKLRSVIRDLLRKLLSCHRVSHRDRFWVATVHLAVVSSLECRVVLCGRKLYWTMDWPWLTLEFTVTFTRACCRVRLTLVLSLGLDQIIQQKVKVDGLNTGKSQLKPRIYHMSGTCL